MYLQHKILSFFEGDRGCIYDARGEKIPRVELRRQYGAIRAFIQNHFRRGARVAISLPYSHPYLLCIYACMESGVTYIPLQPEWPTQRIEQIRRISEFDFLVNSANLAEILATEESGGPLLPRDVEPELPLYIMFTSGTTGEPKGVMIQRSAYENFLRWMDEYFVTIGADDRMLMVTRFTFDIVGIDIGLLVLRQLHLSISGYGGNPYRLAAEIQRHEITCLNTVPNNGMLLMDDEILSRADLACVRHLMLGGARFPHALLSRIRERMSPALRVYNFYGPTEATIYSHVHRLDGSIDAHHHDGNVTIGSPISNVSCLLVDPEGNRSERPYTEGELLIGGVQIMLGYCNDPGSTRRAVESLADVRYYHTGDLAFFDTTARYYIAGRMDETIKRRGYRVNLLDIDAYIMRLANVKDCMTLAYPDTKAENVLLAVIIPSAPVTREVVSERMRSVLPDHQIPDFVEFLEAFPLNNSGKVNRKELAAMFEAKVRSRLEARSS